MPECRNAGRQGAGLQGVSGMAEQVALSFGGLLRQLRAEARLTQEELAEAARLSPRSVSDLERGISRTARKETAGRLAEALNLPGPEREMFVAAARGRASAAEVLAARGSAAPAAFAAAATRRLQRDFADSFGHYAELEHLLRALTRAVADGMVVVVIHPGSDTRDTCRSITPARQSRQREIVLAELTKQAPPDAPEE